jgi:ATP-binding cassette, subfamily B, bacterial
MKIGSNPASGPVPAVEAPGREQRRAIAARAFALVSHHRGKLALLAGYIAACAALGVVSSFIVKAIVDVAIPGRNLPLLLWLTIGLFAVPIASHYLAMRQAVLTTMMAQTVINDIRNRLYHHLQKMSLEFFSGTRAGEIQSRLINDVLGLQGVLGNVLPTVATNAVSLIATLAAMLWISPGLAVISLLLLPGFLLNAKWVAGQRRALGRERQKTLADQSAHIQESLSISGVLLVKSFGREEHVYRDFQQRGQKLIDLDVKQQMAMRVGFMGLGFLFSLIPAVVYLFAGWQIIGGAVVFGTPMTIGALVAFTTLQARLFAPAAQLSNSQGDLENALVIFERIFEYLDLPVGIKEAAKPIRLERAQIRGAVTFDRVRFAYKSREAGAARAAARGDAFALEDVSFTLPPGAHAAVVGPSGGGKTTIGYLLARLLDVDAGAVTIDGYNVKDLAATTLSEAVGIVTQDTFLLHTSVLENLRFARPTATFDEVVAAAKDAVIHDRILALDAGYDTIVGERGFRLSGGEKQRLAIARILLKDPRILVLDEATSALDTRSEVAVQRALIRAMRGRTTITIAHRLSTVINADQILVIEHGRIVERGTHRGLLAQNGLYATLINQSAGEPVAV